MPHGADGENGMNYTIKQDGETWQVLSNGVPLLAGLTKADAMRRAGDLQAAAIRAEAEQDETEDQA
jgi:hypothetical protein